MVENESTGPEPSPVAENGGHPVSVPVPVTDPGWVTAPDAVPVPVTGLVSRNALLTSLLWVLYHLLPGSLCHARICNSQRRLHADNHRCGTLGTD